MQVQSPPIALDLGAGAGLSTAVLYQDLGYRRIDAVDWSADAWDANVVAPVPESVKFYQASDQAFFDRLDEGRRQQPERKPTSQDANEPSLQTRRDAYSYDVIVYNFAVNPQKAIKVAKQRLKPDGLLLAPVNDKADYWYKQSYWVVDASGTVVWTSRPEVGAWSVQFQPDVTSDTCTGAVTSTDSLPADDRRVTTLFTATSSERLWNIEHPDVGRNATSHEVGN
jgi:SAM-dependent methyltransferase